MYLNERPHGVTPNLFKQFVIINVDNDMQKILSEISSSIAVTSTVNIVYSWSFDLDIKNITNDIFLSKDEIICNALLSVFNAATTLFPKEPHMFVLTRNAQTNPAHGVLVGFTRTAIQEYKRNHLRLIDLEYDESNSLNVGLIDGLLKEMCISTNDPEITLKQNCKKNTVERWSPFYERTVLTLADEGTTTTKVIVPARNSDSIRFYLKSTSVTASL